MAYRFDIYYNLLLAYIGDCEFILCDLAFSN